MKKLLAPELVAGLLLGTTSTVFAVEGDATKQSTGTIPLESSISASYTVTIPGALTIDLMSETPYLNAASQVSLTELTAAGSVTVGATVTDLTLKEGSKLANETITTTLTNSETSESLSSFTLTNTNPTQLVKIETTEESKNNKPGDYIGSINFTFDYVEADAVTAE